MQGLHDYVIDLKWREALSKDRKGAFVMSLLGLLSNKGLHWRAGECGIRTRNIIDTSNAPYNERREKKYEQTEDDSFDGLHYQVN